MNRWMKPVSQPFTGQSIPAFLHGVITPMFTPCNPDGSLDERGIRAWTDYLANTGAITTLFPRCGLGRMYALTFDEARRLIDIVIDEVGERLPVMPGTMGEWHNDPAKRPDAANFTRQSIELSQHAEKKGATAVVLVMPSALAAEPGVPLGDTIVAYLRAVAAEIDIPIVLYQPPGLPKEYGVTPELLARILEIPTIAGMKYSSDEVSVLSRLAIAAEGTNFALVAGHELAFFSAIPLGATGVIGQGCAINPETLRAVYDRAMTHDVAGAREAHFDSIRAIDATEGIDCVIAGLMYAARKGAKVQPYTKSHGSPYGHGGAQSIPEERFEVFETVIDTLRSKYPLSSVANVV